MLERTVWYYNYRRAAWQYRDPPSQNTTIHTLCLPPNVMRSKTSGSDFVNTHADSLVGEGDMDCWLYSRIAEQISLSHHQRYVRVVFCLFVNNKQSVVTSFYLSSLIGPPPVSPDHSLSSLLTHYDFSVILHIVFATSCSPSLQLSSLFPEHFCFKCPNLVRLHYVFEGVKWNRPKSQTEMAKTPCWSDDKRRGFTLSGVRSRINVGRWMVWRVLTSQRNYHPTRTDDIR